MQAAWIQSMNGRQTRVRGTNAHLYRKSNTESEGCELPGWKYKQGRHI